MSWPWRRATIPDQGNTSMTTDSPPQPDLEHRAANILNVTMITAIGLVVLVMGIWTAATSYAPFVAVWSALPYETQITLRRFPEALLWSTLATIWAWKGLQSLLRRWRARTAA